MKNKKERERRINSSIKNWEKYQEDMGLLFVPIHWDTLIYFKTRNQDNKNHKTKNRNERIRILDQVNKMGTITFM